MLLGPNDQILLAGKQLPDRCIDVFGRGDIAALLVQLAQPQVDDRKVWVRLAGVGLNEALGILDRQPLVENLVDARLCPLDAGWAGPRVGIGPDPLDLHIAANVGLLRATA
jgi:hypothetical protein